jgi:hypothetical protein
MGSSLARSLSVSCQAFGVQCLSVGASFAHARWFWISDVAYDLIHYFSHHMKVTEGYFAEMKKYHLA